MDCPYFIQIPNALAQAILAQALGLWALGLIFGPRRWPGARRFSPPSARFMAASLDVAVALVEAAVRGAAAGGGTRQVVAAAVAAAFRTAMDYLAEARQGIMEDKFGG